MIFAAALALIAMDQVDPDQEIKERQAPTTVGEMLAFELQTGKLYSKSENLFETDSRLEKPMSGAPMGIVPR